MKTGISTICYAGLKETEDALGLIGETGAEVAEVYLRTFYEYRPEFAKKYANIAVDPKVCLVHVNPPNFEAQLFSPSRRIRGDGFYWLDQVGRSAQLFKAEYFVLHCPKNLSIDCLSGYISGVIDFCRSYNLKIALECDGLSIQDFLQLRERCGELYGVLDLKQAFAAKCETSGYLKDMSGAIAAVHLSDIDKQGKICLPGEGITDFKKLFKELKNSGFDGAAIIDCACNDVDKIKKSYDFINNIIISL